MTRRKQNCPKRMEFGEDDVEGGAVASTTSPVLTEGTPPEDQEDDEDHVKARHLLSPHVSSKERELKVQEDDDLEDEDEEENSKPLVIESPTLEMKPKVNKSMKKSRPKVLRDEDSDDDDDSDDIPLKMVVDEQTPLSKTALDFSVKSCGDTRNKRISTSSPPKEKKVKTSSEASSSTFPLDLSVKKGSHSNNSSIFTKSLSNQMSALRDFMPMIPFTSSSLAKLSNRSDSSRTAASQSLPLPQSPPSKAAASAFASLAMRMGALVPNGVDTPISSNSSPASKSKSGNKTFPGPSGLITRSTGNHGRQNPWQTQWINRSSEQTRDVFTCVWCKESFRSLQEMTLHMKESPRCGMAGMQHAAASLSSSNNNATNSGSSNNNNGTPSKSSRTTAATASSCLSAASSSTSSSPSTNASKEPMSNAVLAKNSVSLPRKLVRGQDVWLGRGAEQTRQILKCMWCAQSFKTLDEMTRHMRVTQHYTNIISQEQIISWRTPEDKLAQAQVNAVLTCKVCDEAFGSLKELSYHMVKNAHYKEHILRSITEGGHGRRRQTRERRKKSLPVRKLLELERMTEVSPPKSSTSPHQKEASCSSKSPDPKNSGKESRHSSTSSSVITCDECGSKVETKHLINHLKSCKRSTSPNADTRSPSVGSSSGSSDIRDNNTTPSPSPDKKVKTDKSEETTVKDQDDKEKTESKAPAASSACLSALQSLIDKSFDVKLPAPPTTSSSRGHHNNNIPSSSSHSEHHHRKLNGHRNHSKEHHSKHSSSKLPVSSSMSAVEKWMALAKERDMPHLWSPSVSSESSSWLCSEDEEEGVALKANKPSTGLLDRDVRSPTSSVGSRPGSVPRAQTSSPSESTKPTAVIKSSSKNKRTSKECNHRKETADECSKDMLPLKNEEEERREEIEELKRSANSMSRADTSSPSRPSTSSASLSALEKLIENSFDSKKKNTPTGFLQRLGIDEEVCPPWQPGLGLGLGLGAAGLPFGHPFQPWLIPKHGGRSSSSSPSKGTKNGSVSSSPPV